MKISFKPALAFLVVTMALSATAADTETAKKSEPAKKPVKERAERTDKTRKVLVTGSYIPQTVEMSGPRVVSSASPLLVFDTEAIRRSGTQDIAMLLRRGGWSH